MSEGNPSRRDKFKAAVADRTRERAEEDSRPRGNFVNYSPEFTAFTVSPVKTGGKVVRLLGLPLPKEGQVREAPTDCKIIRTAWLRGPSGKKWPFVFPVIDEKGTVDKSFILMRLIDKVLDGKWNSERKARDYYHAGTELFNIVKSNGHPENEYEQGWKPSAGFLINCIDRSRMAWHREHKKTLVLSKNYSPNQDPAKSGFYDVGVAPLLYKRIVDDVVEYDTNGDWEEYDVVLRRQKDEPYYYAYHGPDEPKKTTDEEKALIVLGDLTPEERSWELWNFDKAYAVTTYKRILEHVGPYFKMYDTQFQANLYDELKGLVDQEIAAKNSAAPAQTSTQASASQAASPEEDVFSEESEAPQETAPVAATPPPTATRERAAPAQTASTGIPWTQLEDGSFNGTKYLGVSKLTAEEKAAVVSINKEKKAGEFAPIFNYKPELANMIMLGFPPEKFPSPDFFKTDPLTGEALG